MYGSLDGALEKEPRGCVHVPARLIKRFVNDSLRKPQSEQRRHLAFSRIQLFLAARFRVQADHVFFRYTDLAAQLKLKIDELVVVCVVCVLERQSDREAERQRRERQGTLS